MYARKKHAEISKFLGVVPRGFQKCGGPDPRDPPSRGPVGFASAPRSVVCSQRGCVILSGGFKTACSSNVVARHGWFKGVPINTNQ